MNAKLYEDAPNSGETVSIADCLHDASKVTERAQATGRVVVLGADGAPRIVIHAQREDQQYLDE